MAADRQRDDTDDAISPEDEYDNKMRHRVGYSPAECADIH